jgi:hypothetical protein
MSKATMDLTQDEKTVLVGIHRLASEGTLARTTDALIARFDMPAERIVEALIGLKRKGMIQQEADWQ